ncbi:hypothetical protein BU16DRAFT_448997 [Lophium mytilinum]|uniref:Rhodopsin domain-containing protein n=1 Tax=Lophium mytilinum TaxID=390894 RepID=A0A6A6RDP9_9PEZI|nr:hypothetical protein BU16DRAFT_448997 [Lophium mytilinum]
MRFAIESWIWYTVAVGIIVARLISRSILFGSVKRLQYDDWIMGLFVLGTYTTLIVMTNIAAKSNSNLLPPGFPLQNLTSEDISDREYGSKIVIVVEQMQIAVIWANKACLLILYYRLTRMVASKENMAIKLLAVYVALAFFVMEILYFGVWCRPFHEYWAIPTYNSQCDRLTDHRITNAVFNISSDIMMLCIALPMFIRSLLPLKRKLILCCIFSLGIFVILAAILNKYYSFKSPYSTSTWISWYIREASTAILVANLPFTWTLLRKLFNLGAFDGSAPPPATYHSSRTAGGRRTQRKRDSHQAPVSKEKATLEGSQNSEVSKDSKEARSSGSRLGPSETPTTMQSDHSDLPLVPEMSSHPDSWDVEAQRATIAPPKKVHIAPSIASSGISGLSSTKRQTGGGGGGGGGRSARDRKMRAKMAEKGSK